MIISNTPNQTVYAFSRVAYDKERLQYFTHKDCEKLHQEGECDKIFIEDFLEHLNMDCIPTESQYYIIR